MYNYVAFKIKDKYTLDEGDIYNEIDKYEYILFIFNCNYMDNSAITKYFIMN